VSAVARTHEQIFAAIDADDGERVRALIGADPSLASARDAEGVSALMRARYRSNRAVIEAVRSSAAPLDVFEAAAFGETARLEALLREAPAVVVAVSADGFTALHLAAFFGRIQAVGVLLRGGADPNARGREWMTGTPLHSAAAARHTEIVRDLLAAGADPALRQAGGWTPLHSAAHTGDVATVDLLLAAGADPDAVDDNGTSVRSMAEASGDAATIERLVAAGPV
jgi:ankyrin repeat protein